MLELDSLDEVSFDDWLFADDELPEDWLEPAGVDWLEHPANVNPSNTGTTNNSHGHFLVILLQPLYLDREHFVWNLVLSTWAC